ncbi:unnamed protein product [Lasius platythorax]|uniref:Uncharacterized protein n=1 Tax=Lasius platythorax TaxID=488582 RepID=A0AAV2PCP0_9HYME
MGSNSIEIGIPVPVVSDESIYGIASTASQMVTEGKEDRRGNLKGFNQCYIIQRYINLRFRYEFRIEHNRSG